jgi:hypothetical protein
MRVRALVLGLALLLAAPSPAARADERAPRMVGVHRAEGRLAVSVGLQDLFWPEDVERRLRSGFQSRVLLRVELWREGDKQPTARVFRRSDIVYDIWDERFRITNLDTGPPVRSQTAAPGEAIEAATALRRFPVTDLVNLVPGAVYQLRFWAYLNPLSEELVKDVRRWLLRPPGQGRSGAGESFFGSMVSIFVNPNIEESERQLSFRSQTFVARPIVEAGR